MRTAYQLTPDTSPLAVDLPFPAEWLAIVNMTPRTILVRLGSRQAPSSVADADWIVPPATSLSRPVEGQAFGLAFAAPALALAGVGVVDTAQVLFGAYEIPPQFGGLALTGASDLLVHRSTQRAAGGWYSEPFDVPAGVRGITIMPNAASTFGALYTDLLVRSRQPAAATYYYLEVVLSYRGIGAYACRVNPDIETALEVVYRVSDATGQTFSIIGHQSEPPGEYAPSGRLGVAVSELEVNDPATARAVPVAAVIPRDARLPVADQPATAYGVSSRAVGARAVVSLTPPAGQRVYLAGVSYSWRGAAAPAEAFLEVASNPGSGVIVHWQHFIAGGAATEGRLHLPFSPPVGFSDPSTKLSVNTDAAVAGQIQSLTAWGFYAT